MLEKRSPFPHSIKRILLMIEGLFPHEMEHCNGQKIKM